MRILRNSLRHWQPFKVFDTS